MQRKFIKKALMGALFLILLSLLGLYFFKYDVEGVKRSILNVEGQPTLGSEKALVQVVAFQEPNCAGCGRFTLEIFPKIKQEFIETSLIRYSIIPVSFLPGSMTTGASWLCVCAQQKENEEKSFDFITEIYKRRGSEEESKGMTEQELKKIASDVDPSINLDPVFNSKIFQNQIKRNTAYAMRIMEGEVFTPALYVDGLFVDEMDYSDIKDVINRALEKKRAALSSQ